ncbi:hypothetical protein O6H91_06G115300 [Diphasiastrum complanatum]|uniref:Uncharacterized protein n=1 Tax=Diphasiastrum complanatum TaxID=34168 RepID=A0ACC2DHP1_DIPCM|nr:hypothetical protein O6H91_06G115300 [Diphasiastrum complanatum]
MSSSIRLRKVNKIFKRFDVNGDERLSRQEMANLIFAVNPRVKFSEEQIKAILDEVSRTYPDFIDGEKGLRLDGLLRTYDDGAGDLDRDFDTLGMDLRSDSGSEEEPEKEKKKKKYQKRKDEEEEVPEKEEEMPLLLGTS